MEALKSPEPPQSPGCSDLPALSAPAPAPMTLGYAGASTGRSRLSVRLVGPDLLVTFRPGSWAVVASFLLGVVFGLNALAWLLIAGCFTLYLLTSPGEPADRADWCAAAVYFATGLASAILMLLASASVPATTFRLEPCGMLVSSAPGLFRLRRRAWHRDRIDHAFIRNRQLRLRLCDGKDLALLPRSRSSERDVLDETLSTVKAWLRARE